MSRPEVTFILAVILFLGLSLILGAGLLKEKPQKDRIVLFLTGLGLVSAFGLQVFGALGLDYFLN